jgi:poly-beta-hydroxybutyrate-responsive repressor
MRRGHGKGRRYGQRGRLARILAPVLLLLLRREDAHGYTLLDRLGEFGFLPGTLDPSVVYRALREMERDGLVTSYREPASQGPPRRVYRITPAGETALAAMAEDLKATYQTISRFLEAYEEIR